MQANWPFSEPPSQAVISLRGVFEDNAPILLATHEDDGMWQFLDGSEEPRVEDAWVVGLGEVLEHDPSIAALADLPRSWRAWRASASAPWQRGPQPAEWGE